MHHIIDVNASPVFLYWVPWTNCKFGRAVMSEGTIFKLFYEYCYFTMSFSTMLSQKTYWRTSCFYLCKPRWRSWSSWSGFKVLEWWLSVQNRISSTNISSVSSDVLLSSWTILGKPRYFLFYSLLLNQLWVHQI